MSIADNIADVQARIQAVCRQVGRDESEVRLLPVSKTRPAADVLAARAAGVIRFGENRVQEALAKAEELADTDIEWAIIGSLQLNKVKYVARFASEFQALDSVPVAAELNKRLSQAGRLLDVLIQVNTSGEATKSGIKPADAVTFAENLVPFDTLRVRGLMTIAAPSSDPQVVVPCFEALRLVQAQLRDRALAGQVYDELSMGMSGDFELAIEHGATTVRVGTAIFGPR